MTSYGDLSTTALTAIYEALQKRLAGNDMPWKVRVFPDVVMANAQRPYVVMFVTGGGDSNRVRQPDGDYSLNIKCVADTMKASQEGAAILSALLDGQGESEQVPTPVRGNDDWKIVSITQGRAVHLVEPVTNEALIYHDGFIYDFRVQARG
jgi:hypothetical protein